MSRNKIFIITGAIISVVLIGLLIMMQFIQGNASSLENSYTIEIQNCAPVASDNDLMNEFKAALQTTELKGQKGSFMTPLVKINDLKPFGAPIYGMNYVAFYFNSVMYVYSDRKKDTDLFFESYAKNNKAFQDLLKEAKKRSGKEIKLPADFNKNPTEFIIAKGQNDPGRKIFSSLNDLRSHLDDLISKNKITKGTTVKVYYFCGDLSSIKDDDGDGVMNTDDKCPKDSGKKENNGCPDTDKDGIHDGEDQCPDKPGDKDCFGCKCPPPPPCPGDADDDRDGVCNRQDKCPNQFGNFNGCPDNDRDGVLNSEDKCPNEAGELKCNGCKCPEPDKDGDGIFDKADKCPDEYGKSADGCPMKVGVSHNNKSGQFLLSGINSLNDVEAYLEIVQRSGKITIHPFSNFFTPSKDEAGKLLMIIEQPVYMNVDVVIKDKNGKEILRKKYKNLSLLCTKDKECGFIDTKASVKTYQD
jgi:hypothetical protein